MICRDILDWTQTSNPLGLLGHLGFSGLRASKTPPVTAPQPPRPRKHWYLLLRSHFGVPDTAKTAVVTAPQPLWVRKQQYLQLRGHFGASDTSKAGTACACELAAPRHFGATSNFLFRNHFRGSGRSNSSCGATGQLTLNPLCVRSRCSRPLFKTTVRESWLGSTALCFASLCFASLRGWTSSGTH